MARKHLNKPVRLTVLLEEKFFNHVRKTAIDLTTKERRPVTATEVVRNALEKCYPMDQEHDLKVG
jgi:hypothetical protein